MGRLLEAAKMKIEFMQSRPRIEDWRVKLNGQTVGSVWRCGDGYLVSVAVKQSASTQAAAFEAARKQLRDLIPLLGQAA